MVWDSPGSCREAIIGGWESPGGCCEASDKLLQCSIDGVRSFRKHAANPLLLVWNFQEIAFAHFYKEILMVWESAGRCCESIIDGLESPGGCRQAMYRLSHRNIDTRAAVGGRKVERQIAPLMLLQLATTYSLSHARVSFATYFLAGWLVGSDIS